MGWNPSVNFSLRDDEITFCTLIFDKTCAEYLTEELLRIKNGGAINEEYLRQILANGCFTDDELTAAKVEFDAIKTDISNFGSELRAYEQFASWWDKTLTKASYIVGSTTWYQQYKDMKSMAADMYFKLVTKGHTFTPEEKAEYEARYGEVLRLTTATERTELAIRRQYEQNLAEGNEDAREIYMAAMLTAGLMNQAQVDAQNALLNAANANSVAVTMKPLGENECYVDWGLISDLWCHVVSLQPKEAVLDAIDMFIATTKKMLEDAGLDRFSKMVNREVSLFYEQKAISAEDFLEGVDGWVGALNCLEVQDKLKEADMRWTLDEKADKIMDIESCAFKYIDNVDKAKDNIVTVDMLNGIVTDIANVTDAMKRGMLEVKFINAVVPVFEEAGIAITRSWTDITRRFVEDGNVPVADVDRVFTTVTGVINFEANKTLINSIEYEVAPNWADCFRPLK